MKRLPQLLVLAALLPLMAGCKKPAPPAAAAPAADQAASAAPPAVKPVPATLPAVVATVNGESVESWEIENAVKRAEARAGGPVPTDKRDEVFRNVLDQIVAFHMLAQDARSRKLETTAADIDTQMAEIRKSFETEEAFKQNLASQGLTVDQLRRQTGMSMLVQKILEIEVNSKVSVSDADVTDFYQKNLERFKEGETVRASHILIAVPQDADDAKKQAARAKAEQVLKQAKGGADFAKLAREQSQDPGSAPQGGDLGFFPKGQMTPTFEEAAFALKNGAVSGLVESPFGLHIIKVVDRKPPRTMPLEQVSPEIRNFLTQGQRQKALETFLEASKAKAKIQILV